MVDARALKLARDASEAVKVIARTFAQNATAVTGQQIGGTPKIEVGLDDGRTIELVSLTEELLSALNES